MYLRFCSSGQIKKKEHTRLTAIKPHIYFQPIKAVQLHLASAFLFNQDIFWLSDFEESQTLRLQQGMSEFEHTIVEFQIGWRKLTDPGD